MFHEDGSFSEEVRLVRPTGETWIEKRALAKSHWGEIEDRELFCALWDEKVSTLPDWHERSFYLLTGLLLRLWSKLPREQTRIYRLPRDTGPALLGRVLTKQDA